MIIQRYFAIKGLNILYVSKDKADSLPEVVRADFKEQPCGEGTVESFPSRIRKSVEKQGWFVDEAQ
jgi:hypothetical protein